MKFLQGHRHARAHPECYTTLVKYGTFTACVYDTDDAAQEKVCRAFYKFCAGHALRTINLYSLDHKPHPQCTAFCTGKQIPKTDKRNKRKNVKQLQIKQNYSKVTSNIMQ